MISYSQRDSRWVNKKMLPSNLELGRYGCTTTCISDLSTYFGDNLTPAQVCDHIKYTPDGLILWSSCQFAKFGFLRREYGRNELGINSALKDPNMAVILNVANGSHWVVAIGSPNWLNWYIKIADSWTGGFSDMGRYQNNINGAAYFKRK